jgi:hypothetical protein
MAPLKAEVVGHNARGSYVIKPAVVAVFRPGWFNDLEKKIIRDEFAKGPACRLSRNGLPEEKQNSPWQAVSCWDSLKEQARFNWTDKERIEYENKLLDYEKTGKARYMSLVIPEPVVPFPSYYDFKTGSELADFVEKGGYDVDAVLEYEQTAGGDRKSIVNALLKLKEKNVVPEDLVIKTT